MHGEVKAKKSTLLKYKGFPLAEGMIALYLFLQKPLIALLREIYQKKKKDALTSANTPNLLRNLKIMPESMLKLGARLGIKSDTVVHYGGNFVGVLLILIGYQLLFGLPFIGDTKILQTIFDNFQHAEDQKKLAELEKQVAQLESEANSEVVVQRKRAVDDLQ